MYEEFLGEQIAGKITFADTDDANVEMAAFIKVVNGVGENLFAPETGLTREEAATMLSRLAVAVGKPLKNSSPTFADNDSISDWAVDAVGQLQTVGIMEGVGYNSFSPKDSYTLEQSILRFML